MADRSVVVRLQAITTDFQNAMSRAGASVDTFGKQASGSLDTASRKVEALGVAGKVMGGALLLGAGMAVKSFMDFDKQMSQVGAVTGATAAELDKLRDAALQAGADTAFSASDAAAATTELAKAGLNTADILGGALMGSLDLAAAGGLDLAQAAMISAQAMNMFGLAGSDVAHIADLLAAGANKSAADVGTLGAALSQSGNVAASTGLTIEETVGALAAFADNALVGSDAGTSFKSMLQRLTPQSNEAKAKMDELGISAYDAQGNFIGLASFAGQLQTAMKDLTPEARNAAMGVIFGADAVRAANVLYSEGETGIREYTAAVDDQGAAADMAAAMLDNLAGDLEQLRGSIETALIQGGSNANDVLRGLTQRATALVNVVSGLPSPIIGAGIALGALGGAALLLLPGLARAKASLIELGLTADTTRGKLALLGKGVGITALIAIGTQAVLSKQGVDDLVDSVTDLVDAFENGESLDPEAMRANLDALIAKRDEFMDMGSWNLDKIGYMLNIGTRALVEGVATGGIDSTLAEVDKIPNAIEAARNAWLAYQQVVNAVGIEMGVSRDRAIELVNASGVDLSQGISASTDAVIAYTEAQAGGTAASQGAASAMTVLGDETATADDKLRAFTSSMSLFMDEAFGMSDATIASRDAFYQLGEALDENGLSWDINTKKGRENRAAFNDAIKSASEVAVAKYKETGSIEDANRAYEKSIRAGLKAAGMTEKQREAVMRLIGSEGLGSLKPEYFTDVVVDGTTTAISNVMSLISYLDTLPTEKRVALKTEWYGVGDYGNGDGKPRGASGGVVRRGQAYVVGEMGREMFVPNVDGRIVPNHEVEKWSRAERGGLEVQRVQHSRKFADSVTVQVQSAPQERAAESLPRALRRMAFLEDLNA